MKLQYDCVVSDTQENADSTLATSQDVIPPTPPGPNKFILDLSQTAFNPVTGRDDIVIGGPYKAAGNNATKFGSNDIDALIYNGKRRVRIHYTYGGGTNPSTDRSINISVPLIVGPGESMHVKGQWLFEGVLEVNIRKWLYHLRTNGGTTFVLFSEGGEVGNLFLTTHNPAWYDDPINTKNKLLRHNVSPGADMKFGQEYELEFTVKYQSAAGIPDGGLEIKINGTELYSNDKLLTCKPDDNIPKGSTYSPFNLFKYGQQASATTRGVPFDEWRFITDGLLVEKV